MNLHSIFQEIKSDKFCYRNVGRAITKWGAIEKSPIYCYRNIGKITIFKGYQKLFRILMVAIIFSPTVSSCPFQQISCLSNNSDGWSITSYIY